MYYICWRARNLTPTYLWYVGELYNTYKTGPSEIYVSWGRRSHPPPPSGDTNKYIYIFIRFAYYICLYNTQNWYKWIHKPMQFFFIRPPPFGTGLWAAEISSNKYIYILTFPHIYMSIYIWGYSRGRLPGFNYILYNGPNPPPEGTKLAPSAEWNQLYYI